jgi:hypothetical protein
MRLAWGTAPLNYFHLLTFVLALLCVAVAFLRPKAFESTFVAVEERLRALAKHRALCTLLMFAAPILLRVLLLAVYKPPVPFIHDEYAYLLQSDTFASGRLANLPAPFPDQFESIYIFAKPTYSTEYEPAQGLLLALGQRVFGSPWVGVLIGMGLFCAAIYWALQAWLDPPWALAGGLLVVVEIGVLSYWMNAYWGGCVPGIGGGLALGALARMRPEFRVMDAAVCAVGISVLLASRPLEGALLAVLVAGFLVFWLGTRRLRARALLPRVALPMLFVFLPVAGFLAYFNQQVTGKFTQVPYLLYRARYGLPKGFYWQKAPASPAALPVDIEREVKSQARQRQRGSSAKGLLFETLSKLRTLWDFYIGVILTVALAGLPLIWKKRNMDIALFGLVLILVLDNLTYFAYFPHYSAAVSVLIFLALVQCLRVLRNWGAPGLFLSRALPFACLLALAISIMGKFAEPLLPTSCSAVSKIWSSQFEHSISREQFLPRLEARPGKQLVLIRYDPKTDKGNDDDWTFNLADLDRTKVVWARESNNPEVNRELMRYFSDRRVWLAEPDARPQRVIPYPGLNR